MARRIPAAVALKILKSIAAFPGSERSVVSSVPLFQNFFTNASKGEGGHECSHQMQARGDPMKGPAECSIILIRRIRRGRSITSDLS
jgi:hypothetical protein